MIKIFHLSPQMRRGLFRKLSRLNEYVKFHEEPLLCSLLSSLALAQEWGQPQRDRLSYWFGEGTEVERADYQIDLVDLQGVVGVKIQRKNGRPFKPGHYDLVHAISPQSQFSEDRIETLIFSPYEVYENFVKKGLQMVIVRDWALNSFLQPDPHFQVNYLQSNAWEISNITARNQVDLLVNQSLCFLGTHDIADHLLGWELKSFKELGKLAERAHMVFTENLNGKYSPPTQLILAYLVGVLLDDLAQPRWYGSPTHTHILQQCLNTLASPYESSTLGDLDLPASFHHLVSQIRSLKKNQTGLLQAHYLQLLRDLRLDVKSIA